MKTGTITERQLKLIIDTVTEARDMLGRNMEGNSPERDPDDWAMLCAQYIQLHTLLKELLAKQ